MRDRPDYMPPFSFSEGRRLQSPCGVYWTLVLEPLSAAVAVIFFLVIWAPAWLHVLAIVVLIVTCVQAVVYIPRARRAIAEERAVARSIENAPKRRASEARKTRR